MDSIVQWVSGLCLAHKDSGTLSVVCVYLCRTFGVRKINIQPHVQGSAVGSGLYPACFMHLNALKKIN